ncbi:MAG: hypothetical protein ABI548_27120 [Polyangiaceae bacterium]
MKLPWTPKPRNASLEELREQLAHATVTHADAQRATASAQAAFDDAGDTTAEKALTTARAAEQSAGEHLARAQRLAAAAEGQRQADERAELQRKRDELAAKVSRAAVTAAGADLAAAEAQARRAVVDIVSERLALADTFRVTQRELHMVLVQLGEPAVTADEASYAASPMPVRDLLQPQITDLLQSDRQLAELLRDLLPANY